MINTTDRLRNRPGTAADPSQPTRPRRRGGRQSGASLIEVLVVLVVILIGIFAVIQIFPVGFTTLRRTEARLRADRLGRNVTEGFTADSNSLPESITFSYFDPTADPKTPRTTITNTDPDDLKPYGSPPANPLGDLYFRDVNKFRYINNEPIRVPLANATGSNGFGGGVGSVHLLTFGPIYMDPTVGDPKTAPDYTSLTSVALYNSYLKITSDALVRTVVDSNKGNNFDTTAKNPYAGYVKTPNSYVIDYGTGNGAYIMFPPSTRDRVYTISYHTEVSGSPSQVATQAAVTIQIPKSPVLTGPGDVTTGNQYVWFKLAPVVFPNLSPITDADTIQGGTDLVTRDFQRLPNDPTLAPANNWDPQDPYQYKLVSANALPSSPLKIANLGVIAFNPAGANFSVSTAGGVKPFTALASYAVLDWHILHDDRAVPEGGKVRTSLPSIRKKYRNVSGNFEADETVDLTQTGANRTQYYPGLYPQVPTYTDILSLPDDAISPDIQVYNLSDKLGTPTLLVRGDLANQTTTDVNADYWINSAGRGGSYPTGILFINTARVPVGSKVRILYKAQGDWAVSFQKAATAYHLNPDLTKFRPITVGVPNPVTVPPSSIAESFAVDSMGTPTDFTDDRIYFHRSELNKGVTASCDITTAKGTTRLPARQFSIMNPDGDYAYAMASSVFPELASAYYNGDGISGWRINGDINGASLKTRVIWHDESNGRNPWRLADQETYITRQAQ